MREFVIGRVRRAERWTLPPTALREAVRPFPSGAGKSKVSINGGHYPRWRRDGKELFYLSLERKLMAVAVKGVAGERPVFETAAPEELFATRVPTAVQYNAFTYAVSADGKRFLVTSTGEESGAEEPLTVVVNWRPKN